MDIVRAFEPSRTVVLAGNGEAGLAKALEAKPALIVTDYMMPRMDGLEIIRELRARRITTPIVLATSVPERSVQGNPHT